MPQTTSRLWAVLTGALVALNAETGKPFASCLRAVTAASVPGRGIH